ncbi:MAG: hypothetical protein A2161_02345 [Candidatus Schekmanbacteria bacterium RBG_13_48_7]|uniref:Glycosyltransferase 2-like domain-containing protein n=1 Tax=Candidatus Schekmanbacteria bacterium RBG_13_48_7 TaxID=1817878 RepID=A0A1F7RZM6_9BACT|nr:MAG: hypothetical protein A2161_02345 [Candidatus Schekmanbacteria bacterium RBG_13_48_7]
MGTESGKNVSIIIPSRNEADTIGAVISACQFFGEEILVVDGHSEDATREIAVKAGARVVLDHGYGKGDAVRVGIHESRYNFLVFIDADGSHCPEDIPKLVQPLKNKEAQMTLASRMLGGSDELHGNWTNFIRMVGAGFLTLILNWKWKTTLTDTLNGFRAIPREIGHELQLKCNGFEIELEMISKMLKSGGHIVEIPSHESIRKGGQSKLPNSKGFSFFLKSLPYLF